MNTASLPCKEKPPGDKLHLKLQIQQVQQQQQVQQVPNAVGRWTSKEHEIFVKGMQLFPRQWKKIAEMVRTRTAVQIRTHAQKCWNESMNKSMNTKSAAKTVGMAASKEEPAGAKLRPKPVSLPSANPIKKAKNSTANHDMFLVQEGSMPVSYNLHSNQTIAHSAQALPESAFHHPPPPPPIEAFTNDFSPTSVTDQKVFSEETGCSESHILKKELVTVRPDHCFGSFGSSADHGQGMDMYAFKACVEAFDLSPTLSATTSEESLSDDERFSPLDIDLDPPPLINDVHPWGENYLGLLFDEPLML